MRASGVESGTGTTEKAMETLMEDGAVRGEENVRSGISGSGSKSESMGKQRSFGGSTMNGSGAVGKAHRSKTVQGPHPAESRTPKLPARARTSAKMDRERSLEREGGRGHDVGGGENKAKVKKQRVCVRCENKIEDGRWVQVDGGGILCERCWKNMYLPKVSCIFVSSDSFVELWSLSSRAMLCW